MARIKVTGYIDTGDLDPEDIDLSHETGLSEAGFGGPKGLHNRLSGYLDDVEFTLVEED